MGVTVKTMLYFFSTGHFLMAHHEPGAGFTRHSAKSAHTTSGVLSSKPVRCFSMFVLVPVLIPLASASHTGEEGVLWLAV